MASGVYRITCRSNGWMYVGSARDIYFRWSEHIKFLNGGYHDNPILQNAWNKYGESQFEFVILESVERIEGESRGDLNRRLTSLEQVYLDQVSIDRRFNISPIASRPDRTGMKDTPETIERRRQSITGWFDRLTPEEQERTRENRRKAQQEVANRPGRREQMQEARRKSEASVQSTWTEEKRKAVSEKTELRRAKEKGFESLDEYRAWKLKQQEEFDAGREQRELERRRKLSDRQTKPVSEETKQKLREANAIQFSDPEQIESRRQRSLELWSDPDYRAKQNAARKKQQNE